MTQRTMFIAGHGKLPAGSAAKTAYETLAVTVEVDRRHGVVLDADCTLVTTTGRKYVSNLLRGLSLKEDMPYILKEVSECFNGATRNALLAALKDLETEYHRAIES